MFILINQVITEDKTGVSFKRIVGLLVSSKIHLVKQTDILRESSTFWQVSTFNCVLIVTGKEETLILSNSILESTWTFLPYPFPIKHHSVHDTFAPLCYLSLIIYIK